MGVDHMGWEDAMNFIVISTIDDIMQCNLLIHKTSLTCPGGNCHNVQRFSKFLQHLVAGVRTVPSNQICRRI